MSSLGGNRVVDAYQGSLAGYPADNIYRGSFAHVVGVGFESQAKDADGATAQRTKDRAQLGDDQAALVVVNLHHGVEQLGMQACFTCHVGEGTNVFGKAIVAYEPGR